MASGSYIRKATTQLPTEVQSRIPARATRKLQEQTGGEQNSTTDFSVQEFRSVPKLPRILPTEEFTFSTVSGRVVEQFRPSPLTRHRSWLTPWVACTCLAILFIIVLLSAAMWQRPSVSSMTLPGGQAYDVQVGGQDAKSWQKDQPQPAPKPVPAPSGSYSVLGQPTLSVDFMNQVLQTYHSPAAGKAQTLFDLGTKYGIDPAFALAFFMHESSFGTQGEATESLSLGNLRCIPNFRCLHNFAQFDTWEDGFKAWFELIRNLYVAKWNLTTVDKIIPVYAPAADNNDEAAYINALKHALDTWRAGEVIVR